MSRKFARSGHFARSPGDLGGAEITFVQSRVAEGVSHQHIAVMMKASVTDVARYAALSIREQEAPKPAPRYRGPDVVLSLWKGLITRFPGPKTMIRLLEEVADEYELTVADLRGLSRKACIAKPRQDFMWRCRQEVDDAGKPRFSLPQIGRFLGGMDHTTVLHGVRAHEKRLAMAAEAG